MRQPAKNPCGSCPYRRDVPSGVWAAEEYAKLPEYDKDTHEQPMAVFLCHQQNERLCAGWAGTHDMAQSLALRIALSMGHITAEFYERVLDYVTRVPLFATGQAAAEHGVAGLKNPDDKARRIIERLLTKRRTKT